MALTTLIRVRCWHFILFLFLCIFASCQKQENSSLLSEYRALIQKELTDEENVNNPKNKVDILNSHQESGMLSRDEASYQRALIYFIDEANTEKAAEECLPIVRSSFLEKHDTCKLQVYLILTHHFYRQKQHQQSLEFGYQGQKLARELNDSVMKSAFDFAMIEAAADFGSGYYYDELEDLIPVLEQSDRPIVERFLISAYADELGDLMDIEDYERVVAYGEKCLRLINKRIREDAKDSRKCIVASKLARAYLALGQPEKALKAIEIARDTKFAQTLPGAYYLVGYYLENDQKELIHPLLNCEYDAQYSDSITWEYLTLLQDLQAYYEEIHQPDKVAEMGMRMDVVRDSIVHMEHHLEITKAQILSELKVEEMREALDRENDFEHMLIWELAFLVILCLCLMAISSYLFRKHTKEKNRIIQERDAMANSMYARFMKVNRDKEHAESPVEKPVPAASDAVEGEKEEFDEQAQQELLSRMDSLIQDELLYMEENLTREDMARLLHVDKQKLMIAIRTQLDDVTMPTLLNRYRIRHSTDLMKRQPNYTIQAIAEESGFTNVRKFYRIFKEEMGMTPSEYRESLN